MAVTTELAKQWLKVDWDDEDTLIDFLIQSAKEELLKSGVKERESLVYDRAILMLVSHWYSNRTGSDDSNDILSKPLSFGIRDAILKLKWEDISDGQTTG